MVSIPDGWVNQGADTPKKGGILGMSIPEGSGYTRGGYTRGIRTPSPRHGTWV